MEIRSYFPVLRSSHLMFMAFCLIFLLFFCSLQTPTDRIQTFHDFFLKIGSNTTVSIHLKKLTSKTHVAGTPENFETADYVLDMFRRYGLRVHYRDYLVLLSYPVRSSVSMSLADRKLKLFENEVGDRASSPFPPFHAYSPSGHIRAEAIYVNYGSAEDLEELKRMKLSVQGRIAIARQGLVFRGDMVENCANAGALAVLIYPDPQQFSGDSNDEGYPNSKWLPKNGAQSGTVFRGIGDPLSPGWPSSSSSERLSYQELTSVLPKIPSLPISAFDALHIMSFLTGPVAPPHWQGKLQMTSYRVGPGPGVLSVSYVANQTIQPIRNVFGVIKGWEEPDRYVLMGNHRDAWSFGAVDPNSGTSVLLEIAHRFGKMMKQGWRPRRSIILCSWDAEEYGLVGSTEWVEENSALLSSRVVAYINVDCAVAGPGFHASATPQLDQLLVDATKQIKDPDDHSKTVYQSWMASSAAADEVIGRLGRGGSDYSAFLHHVGIPCMDIYFGKDYPVYHSIFDDFLWMTKYGDPEFQRHLAVGQIWGLVSLKLADAEILPFSYAGYAQELESYVRSLDSRLKSVASYPPTVTAPLFFALGCLTNAIESFRKSQKALEGGKSVFAGYNTLTIISRKDLNDRLMLAERSFTDVDGLPNKPWYKHLIYAPMTHDDYRSTPLPGISDALTIAVMRNSTEAWSDVNHEIWRVSRAIMRVALVLNGELT
ncbi:peptidase M28 family protein [Tasmannia lanceolata]|uniref:peptidase M28 family protein n=1 Tax=Tasmannia lanceolata TaxID=3420 RepID=UPI004062C8C8